MLPRQWDTFKRAARGESLPAVPVALIVDSPWIPGYLGIPHMDYYLDPEVWFQANRRVVEEFPEIIFVPSWWVEFGMAAEPSVLGAKTRFWPDNTPSVSHNIHSLDDLDRVAEFDIETDGFAALTLYRMRTHRPRIEALGHVQPLVTARGPMCTAGFVRGTTQFMMDLSDDPAGAHRLLDLCTRVIIEWLEAQRRALGSQVEGIFLLDDLVGFVGEDHYLEFAHPYLKRICGAFPPDWIKLYHNDASIDVCLEHLPDAGFNVLNWGKQRDIREMRSRVRRRMCLMGNVNPLEIAVRGTPVEVRAATLAVLEGAGPDPVILSVGGGVSPGMPRENIRAMVEAVRDFNGRAPAEAAERG